MSGNSLRRQLKLEDIKKNVVLPPQCQEALPCLKTNVTRCTTFIGYGSSSVDVEIDEGLKSSMTEKMMINWCRTIYPLYPLKITGVGNQFLAAVSLALWSFCDGANLLRRLMFVFVSEFGTSHLKERWICEYKDFKKNEMENDWLTLIDTTRDRHDDSEDDDRFPQTLHLFVVSNILRRPLVIIGKEEEEEDLRYLGLYLPLLWKPCECIKWPLVIGFSDGRFFPLVGKHEESSGNKRQTVAEYAVPLVESNLQPFKVRFLLESEEKEAHNLLQNYLNITDLNLTRSDGVYLILSAKLHYVMTEDETVGNGLMPSAPSASTMTLNDPDPLPYHDETKEMSMLMETCLHPGCQLYTSKFTHPYCYEHVDQHIQPSHTEASSVHVRPGQGSSSMVMEHCQHSSCNNYASQYIYPYCYQHIDDRTTTNDNRRVSANVNVNQSSVRQEYKDMSMMPERCIHPNCQNHSSKYTFPACYEHLDSPLVRRDDTRSSIFMNPKVIYASAVGSGHVNHDEDEDERNPHLVNGGKSSQILDIDKKFEKTMKEMESRTKNIVVACIVRGCENFGNSKCRGFCHSCYKMLN